MVRTKAAVPQLIGLQSSAQTPFTRVYVTLTSLPNARGVILQHTDVHQYSYLSRESFLNKLTALPILQFPAYSVGLI